MDSRKASDILLSIEQKLDQLLLVITANDLTMKVIANKLQNLIDKNQNISAPTIDNLLPTVSVLSPEKEEIDINSPPETNNLRMLCISNLNFLEDKFSKEDIRQLEKGIFEAAYNTAQKNYTARNWKTPEFVEMYRQVVRSVLSNIHPASPVKNPRLLNRVLEGEIGRASCRERV